MGGGSTIFDTFLWKKMFNKQKEKVNSSTWQRAPEKQPQPRSTVWWKMEYFFSKNRNTLRMCILTTYIQHCMGGASQGNLARKWNRSCHIVKKEVKLFLFADNTTLHIGKFKAAMGGKKPIRTNKWVSEIIGYSVNI